MTQELTRNKARIIKANHLLQNKVGVGEIENAKIQAMQKIIDTMMIDFVPMGLACLDELAAALEIAKSGKGDGQTLIKNMTTPVMQIKGNAAMFHYELVSSLADLVLNFLENADTLDDDVIEIVDAHHKTLSLIISDKMSGMGGNQGVILKKELQDACARYFKKRARGVSATPRVTSFEKL